MNFQIDPEFRDYLPAQTPEENAALTRKILAEGAKPGSIVVGILPEGRFLVDGHHTLGVCQVKKLPIPEERQITFSDRETARAWMREEQLSRRNLTPERRAYLIGHEYEYWKAKHGGARPQNEVLLAGNTAQKIADEHNTSKASVERNAAFAAGVDKIGESDPEAKVAILKGTAKVTKAKVIAAGKSTSKARVRCYRCLRLNRWADDCPQCLELRGKPKSKPKAPDFDDPSDDDEPPPRKKGVGGSANAGEAYRVRFEKLYDGLLQLFADRKHAMGTDKHETLCRQNAFDCRKNFIAWESG